MRIFFDAEFYEDGIAIDLISIALVREDGETFYAETCGSAAICHNDPWLLENVKPHLRGGLNVRERDTIAHEILEFVGEKPEFWAYYAAYDWVVLCQLYGRMIDLPAGWPMFCRDVKQLHVDKGEPALPDPSKHEHDALADALWCREAWRLLTAG